SIHPFCASHRDPCPPDWARRRTLCHCRVCPRQTPVADPHSFPPAVTESSHLGPSDCRVVCSADTSQPPDPIRDRSEAFAAGCVFWPILRIRPPLARFSTVSVCPRGHPRSLPLAGTDTSKSPNCDRQAG